MVTGDTGARPRLMGTLRKREILAMVRSSQAIEVAEIARHFGVSQVTIRRDLTDLERKRQLTRTHGGALCPPGIAMDAEEPSFGTRLARGRRDKESIARAALPLIGPARTLALDVGATIFVLAQHLRARPDLNVFTNALRIASCLSENGPSVFIPAGRVRGNELAVVGPSAAESFEKFWFDVAFIGASGITPAGIFDYSLEDTEIKRVYLRRSTRKILLCDATKFQRMSLVRVADFTAIDMLVTDTMPPAPLAAALRAANVRIHIATEAAQAGHVHMAEEITDGV